MVRSWLYLSILAVSMLLSAGCDRSKPGTEEILVCGDRTVLILDGNRSQGEDLSIRWQWEVDEIASIVPASIRDSFSNVDECKFVDGGRNVLITCGAGGVALIDRASRQCLFYACCPLSHSADLLPGGRVVVALSVHPRGNAVELFDITRPSEPLFRDTLYSGHGSVWLEARQRYYALGSDELREYSLQDWDTPAPKLKRERSWMIPVVSGHDLSAASDHQLLVSGHEGVVLFDIDREEFHPFEPLEQTPHVKAVNYDPATGRLLYTKAEQEWWTHNVYGENPTRTITIPWLNIYKARTFPVHRGAVLP